MIKQCQNQTCMKEIPKKSKQWLNQIFCSTKCRKAAHRKKTSQETRIARRRANLRQNDEVLRLVSQCRRARSVQILEGHDIASFIETMTLVKKRPKGDLHLCHIAPVKGKSSIGLFHCRNLFYAGAHQNRKFGNKWASGGLSIKKENILDEWKISEEMSTNEILIKIEEYLGNIVGEYIKSASVTKSKRAQLANKINGVDPKREFDELMRLDHSVLREEWSKLSNHPFYKITYNHTESKYITYIYELSRFVSYGGDRVKVMKKLIKTMAVGYVALSKVSDSRTYNKDFEKEYGSLVKKFRDVALKNENAWSEFKDLIYDAAFKTLQGEPLKAKKFHSKIMSYLDTSVKHALS